MTVRVATTELARKGTRYRPLADGLFELSSTAVLRGSAAAPGRVLVADNFIDVALLAPGVDVLEATVRFQGAGGLSNTTSGTYGFGVHDAVTAVPGVWSTGIVGTELQATAIALGQAGATTSFHRTENTGAAGSGTFVFNPTAIPTNLNNPRAFPLSGLAIPAPTGTRLVRFRCVVAPSAGEQATAIQSDRTFTFTLVCAPAAGYIRTPTQIPYEYADRRDNTTLSSGGLVS